MPHSARPLFALFGVANSRTSVPDVVWGFKFLYNLLCGEIIESAQKLTVAQLVKNLPVVYITRRFIAVFTKAGLCALSEAGECRPHIRTPFLKITFRNILK